MNFDQFSTTTTDGRPVCPPPLCRQGSTFQYVDLSNLSLINVQAMGEGAKPMVFTGQLAVEGDRDPMGMIFHAGWVRT